MKNPMDHRLRQLMSWARLAPPPAEPAPWGFAHRVVARSRQEPPAALGLVWEQWMGRLTALAVLIIVSGVVCLASWGRPAAAGLDFAAAYQYAARSMAP